MLGMPRSQGTIKSIRVSLAVMLADVLLFLGYAAIAAGLNDKSCLI
jgi:hypothetical protein